MNQLEQYPSAVRNANFAEWTWIDQTDQWSPASQKISDFNDLHRKIGQDDSMTGNTFSTPFQMAKLGAILIRDSYRTTFDGLWQQTWEDGPSDGYLITGQPGIGKSLFLYYALIRLLQLKQPVLFSDDGAILHLFYHDNVYVSSEPNKLLDLPFRKDGAGFIWSLFDIKALAEPAVIFWKRVVCPIQVASPNPGRYHTWRKEREPRIVHLPLWKKSELEQALPLQQFWPKLQQALKKRAADPRAVVTGALASALSLLEPRAPVPDEDGHSALATAVEHQIDELLDVMIDCFGPAARDVFGGINSYEVAYGNRESAFDSVDPDTLASCIKDIRFLDRSPSHPHLSHRLFAVRPIGGPFDYRPLVDGIPPPRYEVIFKSDSIKLRLIKLSLQYQDAQIRRLTLMTKAVPATAPLADTFFETLAHRTLCAPASEHWPILRMNPDPEVNSTFCLDRAALPQLPGEFFDQGRRSTTTFPSKKKLPKTFKHRHYYQPSFSNLPLIDSFTVDIDPVTNTCVLWLLQMTISDTHGGSPKGYEIIREIMQSLRDTGNTVTVRYLLVVPDDDKSFEWQFPEGWAADVAGPVHCLKLTLLV